MVLNSSYWWILSLLTLIFVNCSTPGDEKLPIIGFPEVVEGDTVWPSIRPFSFVNQDSLTVTNDTYKNQIYITDFFFTSCPTICPKVKQQMLRIYKKYENNGEVALVSHTIDPKRDNVSKLKDYAGKLGVSGDKWHFLTGNKDSLHSIAVDYMSIALENPDAPGGFDHSGRLILVDREGHVRSYCNGTDPKEVDRFMHDIDLLLHEGT